MREDGLSQCDEAISRLLFTCLHSALPVDEQDKLSVNTNEELQPMDVNLAYLRTTIMSTIKSSPLKPSALLPQHFDSFCQAFQGHQVHTITNRNVLSYSTHLDTSTQPPNKRVKTDETCELPNNSMDETQANVRIYSLQKMDFNQFLKFLEKEYDINVDVDSEAINKSYSTEKDNQVSDATELKPDTDVSESELSISSQQFVSVRMNQDVKETSDAALKDKDKTVDITWADVLNSFLDTEVIQLARNVLIRKVNHR